MRSRVGDLLVNRRNVPGGWPVLVYVAAAVGTASFTTASGLRRFGRLRLEARSRDPSGREVTLPTGGPVRRVGAVRRPSRLSCG
ncbi:MAG: hypothetical protein LC799_21635, partial [Actinobacteria bacterium]|nr:hypothetical protein [Actinomycetota bacterium]